LQCSGKTASFQIENYNASQRESKPKFRNQFSATTATTSLPANSHAFSAEDYDILQDAESLQQALSIVAYEPQKVDIKKADNISKNIETFGKRYKLPYKLEMFN
jgi:hypothetical protein